MLFHDARQGVPGTTRIADFRDGTSNSVLVGSVGPDRKIPWTKPEDVVFDEHFPDIGKLGGFAAPYKTDQGAGGVFLRADGSCLTIREDVNIQSLRNLFEIADGNLVDSDDLPSIPIPGRTPPAMPVLELKLGGPEPSARLVLEPMVDRSDKPGPEARQHVATPPAATPRPSAGKAGEWTCSMHPQIRLSRPGKCPICAMYLIPAAPQGADKPSEGENSDAARPAAPPVP